jgi:hypothetical protein
MKKIILVVIVLAAAGGGAYYLLKKKNNTTTTINKELATGKWKIDSLGAVNDSSSSNFAMLLFAMDSTARDHIYDFLADGKVVVTNPHDSSGKKDSSSFAWGKEKEILWKEKSSDSLPEIMTVVKLDSSDFILRSKDSVLVYFKKIK